MSGFEPQFDAAEIEQGRVLFSQSCDFVWGAEREEQLPEEGLPEIAFAGRSNVGKSSLINALVGQKALARVSHTPGRTQQLNFFNLGGRLQLVDLPGYGFAAVSKARVKGWHALIGTYLRGRVSLRRACVLIDSRHGFKDSDLAVLEMLDEAAVPYQVVLTKMDDCNRAELEKREAQVLEVLRKHPAAFPTLALTSSRKGYGIAELRAGLAQLAV